MLIIVAQENCAITTTVNTVVQSQSKQRWTVLNRLFICDVTMFPNLSNELTMLISIEKVAKTMKRKCKL